MVWMIALADSGGKRRKICIKTAYLADSIDSVLSWPSGGREFGPRQLHQKSFIINHLQVANFSPPKLATFGSAWVAFFYFEEPHV